MPKENRDVEAVLSKTSTGWRPNWSIIFGIAVILAAGAAWYWWAGSGTPSAAQYVTETVDRGDITVSVTATGSVEPTNRVEISSELSGTIRSVEFDFNDTIKAGDVLARLDTQTLEANQTRARANVTAAEAKIAEVQVTLDETRKAYERATQLAEKGLTSNQALLTAKSSFDRAAASMKSAEANLAIAMADLVLNEANLAKACICSPIDGVVLERNVEVGQIVAASFSAPVLFILAEDLAHMQLQVDIDEADIGLVDNGDQAMFTVEAYYNKSFPAVISELRYAPLTVNGVVTYKAILAIDNAELLLRPGMTATAEIIVAESHDVLQVPNAALRFTPPASSSETSDGGGLFGLSPPSASNSGNVNVADTEGRRTVWVLRGDTPQPVLVTTGATDGISTEIVDGDLISGDPVIVDIGAS